MRKIIFLIAIFLEFFFVGCHKDPVEPSPHINTLSALVNGTAIVPTKIEVLFGGSSVQGARQVNIYVTEASGRMLVLVMTEYNGTLKTFTTDVGSVYPTGLSLYTGSSSNNGGITLTSFDKTKYKAGEVVTGTFFFNTGPTNGTYSVTNGSFSVFVTHE